MKGTFFLKFLMLVAVSTGFSSCGDEGLLDILEKLPIDTQGIDAQHRRHLAFYESCKGLCEHRLDCDALATDEQTGCVGECIEEFYLLDSDVSRLCADVALEMSECLTSETTCEEVQAWDRWNEAGDDLPPPPVCETQFKTLQAVCG